MPSTRNARLFAWGFGGIVTCAVVLLIVLRPGVEPMWDQSFIGYRFAQGYPHFESGIVSHLLVGLVNSVVPFQPEVSNTLVRAVAALLYVGAASVLAWSVTGPERLRAFVAFVLLVVSTGFPFLWLSSELFAGAFLMLLLWSVVREHSIVVLGLLLGLFAFSKADLALPGLLMGAYLVLRAGPVARWRRALVVGAVAAVLLVPSLWTPSYYARFGGRTWVAFSQHYGELVKEHQLGEAPSGFGAGRRYTAISFPGATTVGEAALRYPRRYVHFVALALAESSIRLVRTKLLLLLPAALLLFGALRPSWRISVLILLSSLVPIVLLSFLHVRYQARLYPLALFVIFAGLRAGSLHPWQRRALAALLAAVLVWQLVDIVPVLGSAHWLPD
jgi:hypothetical protein